MSTTEKGIVISCSVLLGILLFFDFGFLFNFHKYNVENQIFALIVFMCTLILLLSVLIYVIRIKYFQKHKMIPVEPNKYSLAEKIIVSEESVNNISKRSIDDYVKSIFLYFFTKHPYKQNDNFPSYVIYELGITNTAQYFSEMVQEGFLSFSSEEDILNMLKVYQLREILSDNGLKKTGTKQELIRRIVDNVNKNTLHLSSNSFYSLSPMGKEFIEQHYDYIKLRQNNAKWRIGIREYIGMKNSSSNPNDFNTIILSLLNKKLLKIRKKSYDLSQYEYSRLHDIYISAFELLKENNDFASALQSLLASLLLSLSGCKNFWLIGYKRELQLKNNDVMKSYAPLSVDPYVSSNMIKLKDYYNDNLAKTVYESFIGPYNLCTLEIFLSVINRIFRTSILKLDDYDALIKQEFIKKLK